MTTIGYHYTTPKAYRKIRKNGLMPNPEWNCLSPEVTQGVTYGLLEPGAWKDKERFPYLWRALMLKTGGEGRIVLLSFGILPTDKAYVLERYIIERANDIVKPVINSLSDDLRDYWDSRIPACSYTNEYYLPELLILEPIEPGRLKFEWAGPTVEVL